MNSLKPRDQSDRQKQTKVEDKNNNIQRTPSMKTEFDIIVLLLDGTV